MEELRVKIQVRDIELDLKRNTKIFYHGLEKYMLQSVGNQMHVTNCDLMQVDIIKSSHRSHIQVLDIAQESKDIVSYSTLVIEGKGLVSRQLIVHGLEDIGYLVGLDRKVTYDQMSRYQGNCINTPKRQHLKWREYWKCEESMLVMESFLNTVSISALGDVMFLGGHKFMSVWIRDANMSVHSYSNHLYYAEKLPKDLLTQNIEEMPMNQIIQSEFSSDGRTIISLEQHDNQERSIKVWYNSSLRNAKEFQRPFFPRHKKAEMMKDFQNATMVLDKLDFFELPKHRFKIIYFEQLKYPQSSFERHQINPICFMTVTEKGHAFLWVEELNLEIPWDDQSNFYPLSFKCVHTFKHPKFKLPSSKMGSFDVEFMTLKSSFNSETYRETPLEGMSRILQPLRLDHIQAIKRQAAENVFDGMIIGTRDISQDFIVVLCGTQIQIFSALGIRNFPTMTPEITLEQTFPLYFFQNDCQCMSSIIQVSADSRSHLLEDELNMLCFNKNQEIVKLQKKQDQQWNILGFKVRDIYQRNTITHLVSQEDLPLLAMVKNERQVCFFTQKRVTNLPVNQQNISDSSSLYGFFESQIAIKKLKWLPGHFKLLIQTESKIIVVNCSQCSAIRGHLDVKSILDFGILQQKTDSKFTMFTIEEQAINFIELIINEESNSVEFKLIEQKKYGKIEEVFASQTFIVNREQPYLDEQAKTKLLLNVRGQNNLLEARYIELQNNNINEIWKKELPLQNPRNPLAELDYKIKGRISENFATILLYDNKKNYYHLHIYEQYLLNRYTGFLDLLKFVDFRDLDSQTIQKQGFALDYQLLPNSNIILLTCLDTLYVIVEQRTTNYWFTAKKIELMTNIDVRLIESLKIHYTPRQEILIVQNDKDLITINKSLQVNGQNTYELEPLEDENEEEVFNVDQEKEDEKENQDEPVLPTFTDHKTLAHIEFENQKSHNIYSVDILKNLFINGKTQFIMKLLIQTYEVLQAEHIVLEQIRHKEMENLSSDQIVKSSIRGHQSDKNQVKARISNIINFTLNGLLDEITKYIESQVVQVDEKEPKKQNKFGGFFGDEESGEDEGGLIDFDDFPAASAKTNKNKDKKETKPAETGYERQFLEIFEKLLKYINKTETVRSKELIEFILIFKQIQNKDFFSDEMATVLLKEIYLETEQPDKKILDQLEKKDDVETEVVKKLMDHEIYALMYGEKNDGYAPTSYLQQDQVQIIKLGQWNSRKVALAMFTVNQDVIMEELQSRFDIESNATWEVVRNLGIPVWMKDSYKLRNLLEWVAKVAYREINDQILKQQGQGQTPPSRAEATSLWYILMNKKHILIDLYKKEAAEGGDKVATMLSQDFQADRWKKAALKNAMVLRQKQRFLLSATFFILGNDLQSALQIIKQSMRDPVLGVLFCRMMTLQYPNNDEVSKLLEQVYDEYFLKRGDEFGDIYLKSIGLWGQKKYVQAVNALQIKQQEQGQSIGSIFSQEFSLNQEGVEKKQKQQDLQLLPLITENAGFELSLIVKKLKKAPLVNLALKQDEGSGGYGADTSDLLNDFFSAPSQIKQEQQEKKKEEKPKLEIDDSIILNHLLLEAIKQKNTLQALFLIKENKDVLNFKNESQLKNIKIICRQIIKDSIEEVRQNPSFLNQFESIRNNVEILLKFMIGDEKVVKNYIQRQVENEIAQELVKLQGDGGRNTGSNTMLRYELELRLEARQRQKALQGYQLPRNYCSMNTLIFRLEEETYKFLEFINQYTSNPFLENSNKKYEFGNLLVQRQLILDLEQHIDCLIIFDHYEDEQKEQEESLDKQEIEFFKPEEAPKKEEKKQEAKKPAGFDPFFDMMGGDSDDEMDLMDFDNFKPQAKKEKKEDAKESDQQKANQEVPQDSPKLIQIKNKFEQLCSLVQRLASKIRVGIVMYLNLCLLSFNMSKFSITKDLLSREDLLKIIKIEGKKVEELVQKCNQIQDIIDWGKAEESSSILKELDDTLCLAEEQYSQMHLQNLKTHIQKFKCSIEKKLSYAQDNIKEHRALVELDSWELDLSHVDEGWIENDQFSELEQQMALLVSQGHLKKESYEFINLWLKFIIINNVQETLINLFKDNKELSEFFKQRSLIPQYQQNCPFKDSNELIQQQIKKQTFVDTQLLEINPVISTDEIMMKINQMSKILEDECSIYFQEKLNVLQRKYIVTQLSSLNSSIHLFPVLMKYFFKSFEKMNEFWYTQGISDKFVKPLAAQYLTLLGRQNTAHQDELERMDGITQTGISNQNIQMTKEKSKGEKPQPKSASQQITSELMQTGMELFKQRGSQISDFAFDRSHTTDNIALGMMGSGIREIPVLNTILYRNRIENGLQLIDEENLTWEECLNRYDLIEQAMVDNNQYQPKQHIHEIPPSKDEPKIVAVDSLFTHKTIFQRSKLIHRKGLTYLDKVLKPSKYWNGSLSENYLTRSSKLDITHEDYTHPVESHPHLPLYVSGNRRGIMCVWKFGQSDDKSLLQFMPEVDPRQADPKKACVKKIQFNLNGDKIMSNNMEGSLSMYQLDCQSKNMRKVPVFSLYDNVDAKVTDFDLVNHDNILCTISQKQKTIKIYDILLPYSFGKQAQVMETKVSGGIGNIVLCNKRNQVIYTFNSRTGAMSEFDLRMGLAQLNQYQLSDGNEITAACLNESQDSLITGYKDGFVKIHSLVNYYYKPNKKVQQELYLRDNLDAFPFDFRNKKGVVQRLRVNEKNGGLFACSQSGMLKLLRTSV